jgi:hypothetical protein
MTFTLALAAVFVLQTPQQFDLVCPGTAQVNQEAPLPSTHRIRVDLERELYCIGTCETVRDIVEITSGELVLDRSERAGRAITEVTVNRITGQYINISVSQLAGITLRFLTTGRCRPEAFSGLPTAAF